MSDVTRILSAIEQGDPFAAGELLPLVYDELRKLAAERMGQENPGHTASNPDNFKFIRNLSTLFFAADDGTRGREPWQLPV